MNYESMSDFEINKAVVDSCDTSGLIPFVNNERSTVYLCEKDGIDSLNMVCDFDPCNNPSDAWPIILENKIGIDFRDHKSLNPIAKRFGSNGHNIADKNPLRAAMVVFLMMNENK